MKALFLTSSWVFCSVFKFYQTVPTINKCKVAFCNHLYGKLRRTLIDVFWEGKYIFLIRYLRIFKPCSVAQYKYCCHVHLNSWIKAKIFYYKSSRLANFCYLGRSFVGLGQLNDFAYQQMAYLITSLCSTMYNPEWYML